MKRKLSLVYKKDLCAKLAQEIKSLERQIQSKQLLLNILDKDTEVYNNDKL